MNIRILTFLFSAVLSSVSMAATVVTVNTTVDEDGENSSACSLREAVKSANQGFGFGGCGYGTTVQLAAGVYKLTPFSPSSGKYGQLVIKSSVTIKGASVLQADKVSPYTGQKPYSGRPSTTITADDSGRLFFVDESAGLALQDVIITKGKLSGLTTPVVYSDQKPVNSINTYVPAQGGLAFVYGALTLSNVEASYGSAVEGGGAFALFGNASLSSSGSWLHHNSTTKSGGVVVMPLDKSSASSIAASCKTNNIANVHKIDFANSTVEFNTSLTGAAVVEPCGNTTLSAYNSTFNNNDNGAGSGSGAVIDWSYADADSTMSLNNVTMVENDLAIRSAAISQYSVTNSVVFWNVTDCSGAAPLALLSPGVARHNVFSVECAGQLNTTVADVAVNPARSKPVPYTTGLAAELARVAPATGSDLVFPLYVPVAVSSIVMNQGGADTCREYDARGVARTSGSVCDIGAAERLQLTAIKDEKSNSSKTGRVITVDVLDNDLPEEGSVRAGLYSDYHIQPMGCSTPAGSDWNAAWGAINSHISVNSDKKLVFDGAAINSTPFTVNCDYRIVKTADNSVFSNTATLTMIFNNIVPATVEDEVILYSSSPVMIDPLANDADGDGGSGLYNALSPSTFKVTKFPEVGVLTCLSSGKQLIDGVLDSCPGGALKYAPNSGFTQFGDAFSYTVEDVEGLASEETKVTIKPTGQDTYATGGSPALWMLPLLSFLWLSRRQVKR